MTENGKCNMSIVGTGSYVPSKILTNHELTQKVDTSDEWIVSRTGIKERRIAAAGEATSDLAYRAAQRALEDAGVEAEDLDMIIVATISPDSFFPATACYVQSKLGAKKATAFDISAACSGFLFAMQISRNFINAGSAEKVLIIGAEKLSALTNWEDRNTCVLFGDGAGAAVLVKDDGDGSESKGARVLSTVMGSDGDQTDILVVPGGGAREPVTPENIELGRNKIHMLGREVYKHAVTAMKNASIEALAAAGLKPDAVSIVIPHQANLRIIEAIVDRLGLGLEKTFINLDKYGNTSAAAIAIALDEANKTKAIKKGDIVLLVAFGAGLTWAASVVEW
ncbi:MAG: 3-oxoacyl-[acyl-carrier-protein] synthase-3 [Verrucomicrobiales bacterium]|jgi:3-oxoacyl-[acyl-carrier-protein] synthase-3